MKRKPASASTSIVLMAGMFFTGSAARADSVSFNLSLATFSGNAGQTVSFLVHALGAWDE